MIRMELLRKRIIILLLRIHDSQVVVSLLRRGTELVLVLGV